MKAGETLEGMHIRDTAPTLLHSLDQPVCGWMEGHVMTAAFDSGSEPRYDHEDEPEVGNAAGAAFTDEEAASVEESLRGLGYLQ